MFDISRNFFKKCLTRVGIFYIMKKYQKISPFLIFWPHGQSVKTSPFHGGVRGSTPLEATRQKLSEGVLRIFY